jgi:hypothetical protein
MMRSGLIWGFDNGVPTIKGIITTMNNSDLYSMIAMNWHHNVSRPNLSIACMGMPTGAECLAESIAIVEEVCGPMEAIELLEECGL